MPKRIVLALLWLAPWSSGACAPKIDAPRFAGKEISERAFAEYDLNKDGFLDAQELERCPGLKSCLKQYDRDKDGRLNQAELEEAFGSYGESQVRLLEVRCKVTLDGRPLAGATVALEPESFMGDCIKPAKGTTDERGQAGMQIEGAAQRGCHLGVYRVRISKTDVGGQESLAARYNTQTQLGIEVGPGMKGVFAFPLSKAR